MYMVVEYCVVEVELLRSNVEVVVWWSYLSAMEVLNIAAGLIIVVVTVS